VNSNDDDYRRDYHPLTQKILEVADTDDFFDHPDFEGGQIDAIVREYVTPPVLTAESGVRFPDHPDTPIEMAGNFITSGNQMQMVLVGTEPVLVVQPEYDAETRRITLITTAVDLPPAGLVQVLEALLDSARTIVEIQAQQQREIEGSRD